MNGKKSMEWAVRVVRQGKRVEEKRQWVTNRTKERDEKQHQQGPFFEQDIYQMNPTGF